nr:dehydration-responsive element-binding transcription factor [Ammopiptanthus mongolicus]
MVKLSSMEKDKEEQSDSSCKYKGVRKRKWGKWVSEIRLPNCRQRIWLGSYDTPEKAARAFDAATFCLRGRNARFNFPDNPPDIIGGRSMVPSQIQIVAARFANSEPHRGHTGRLATTGLPMECSSELQHTKSPSPSLSDGTVQTDSDDTLNGSFPDLFATIGSGNFVPDYGIYPGFDDLSCDYYVPEMRSVNYYEEENMDGLVVDDSFLWNF